MQLSSSYFSIGILVTALLLIGCSTRVEYMLKNETFETVKDLRVISESGFRFDHGTLLSGAHSSFSGAMKLDDEDLLTISWTAEGAELHEQTLSVRRATLQDTRMRVFTITPEQEIEESWRWEE